jgi:ATP-dependent DNA helicase DinG
MMRRPEVARELAEITDGGIFVLFTSYRALRSTGAHPQMGDGPGSGGPSWSMAKSQRHRLLSRFTGSGRGILLGTSSFWEGVDVPGDPLRGLILQKLPFRVPTEPITQARMEALESRGGERVHGRTWFPLAALRLKQGFGRLIRSRDDRGAVLLLDSTDPPAPTAGPSELAFPTHPW